MDMTFCSAEGVGRRMLRESEVGMPVCGQGGGAEITHVFTYVDRCAAENTFGNCSIDDALAFG